MEPSLVLIIVLTFAFAATRLEHVLFGERTNLLASLEYLVIGFLVGPLALNFLDAERLASLEPLLGVVTGFAGFLVGLPLSFGRLSDRPRGTVRFALVAGLVAAALVAGLAWLALSLAPLDALDGLSTGALLMGAATLGVGAIVSSVESVRAVIVTERADGPVARLLPSAAQTIRVLAICGFGLALATHRADDQPGAIALWDAAAVASGVGLGIIFHVFVGDEHDHKKLFVATIGIVALASGVADALHFSPLFVNMVAGATIANISSATPDLLAADIRLRRPVFVVLLILAGATWQPIPGLLWLVPLGFVIVRMIALRVGARVAIVTAVSDIDDDTPRFGNALLSQGALVAAIAVNYHMVVTSSAAATPIADVILTTLLLSAVVNEIWFGPLLRSVLRDAGESGRLAAPDAKIPAHPCAADIGREGDAAGPAHAALPEVSS